jgi:hypothetical protein
VPSGEFLCRLPIRCKRRGRSGIKGRPDSSPIGRVSEHLACWAMSGWKPRPQCLPAPRPGLFLLHALGVMGLLGWRKVRKAAGALVD